MKVLLLNPPGKKIYTRDYYCSKVSKSDYIYQPIDLLVLSGVLNQKYDIAVIDAIAERIGWKECEQKINSNNYDAIIFLTGSVSWEEDARFIKELKDRRNFLAIGTGDILLADYKNLMKKNNFLDAVILDFTTDDILRYLDGQYELVENMAFWQNGKIIDKGASREFNKEISVPPARHDLFLSKKYNYPFVRRHPFATILTDYGCPFKCNFCVMNTIGFKYRNVNDAIAEIREVKKLGFKNIYFGDQTFGANQERLKKICDFMIAEGIDLGWVCWSRVDVVNEELLKLMKRAGCHTILFGVETSNDEILKQNNKGFTSAQIKKTFQLCKRLGIRTLGTFIFGLPGEDLESCRRTIGFAKEIGADFASFNILIPRMNTKIREEAIGRGWVDKEVKIMDQSGSFAVMGNDKISAAEIMKLKDEAIKRFYFRPAYLWRRLVSIGSWYELRLLAANGFALLKNTLRIKT